MSQSIPTKAGRGNNSRRKKLIDKLSEHDLEKHLRIFCDRIQEYNHLFNIDTHLLEHLRRQQVAFSWLVTIGNKLESYLIEVSLLKQNIQSPDIQMISTLQFLDLPRPPVFYFDGDIIRKFKLLVQLIQSSEHYTNAIGYNLGIEFL